MISCGTHGRPRDKPPYGQQQGQNACRSDEVTAAIHSSTNSATASRKSYPAGSQARARPRAIIDLVEPTLQSVADQQRDRLQPKGFRTSCVATRLHRRDEVGICAPTNKTSQQNAQSNLHAALAKPNRGSGSARVACTWLNKSPAISRHEPQLDPQPVRMVSSAKLAQPFSAASRIWWSVTPLQRQTYTVSVWCWRSGEDRE